MSSYTARARIALADPEAVLAPLCEHMVEHGAVVDRQDGACILSFRNARASFRQELGATCIDVVAASLEALYFARMNIAAHIAEFAAEAAPLIDWTGDGSALARPPNFQVLRVLGSRDVTPRMRRITFSGDDVARFAPLDALHLNILVQHPERREPQWPGVGANGLMCWEDPQRKPFFRKYTVRALDPAAGTLDIDFVLHADAGPGSDFAVAARPGDALGIVGPGGGGLADADWYLFAGDETALPAIARMLEHLPACARGLAFVEVADEGEIQAIDTRSGVELSWLCRNGAAPGTTDLLVDALRNAAFPADGSRLFVWTGCEYGAFRTIRGHLREERGLRKEEHLAVSYWRRAQPRTISARSSI